MLSAAPPVARGGKSLGDRKRNARMPRDCGIGLGLGWVWEAGYPAHLAERPEIAVATGEDLPRVCLVAYVPYDAVSLGIEDLRKGHRDLDRAERRRKMPAVLRNGLENPVPQFNRLHLSVLSALRLSMRRGVAFCPNASSLITRS